MATVADASSREIPFATFSAANEAAILLFELIQAKVSPPTLISDGNSIGYHISLPLPSGVPSSGGADPDSNSDSSSDSHPEFVEWRIGAGASPALVDKGLDHNNPDILLCVPGATVASKTIRKIIKDIHAYITFHSNSGVLMFSTICDRPIIYEQGDIHDNDLTLGLDEWGKPMACVLRRERNYFRFGPYRFLFKFETQTRRNYDKFIAYMNENVKSDYHGLNPSRLFNFIPMPSPYHETSWNVWLHHKIPTTHITTGVNIHTGQPVAVKKLRNKDIARTRQHVIDRLQMALQYKDRQDSGIFGIIDIWCEHQTSPPCLLDVHNNEMFDECRHTFYSMPLAGYNFLDLPWTKIAHNIRLVYIHQTLLGLAELHRQDLVHGNIRPGSLLLLANTQHSSCVDAKALATKKAVISLSMSQVEEKMFATTSICIAPEVWLSRDGRIATDLDRTKLDIWAIAASWLYAFTRPPSKFKVMTADALLQMQSQIAFRVNQNSLLAPFATLLRQMLAWEPQDRPSVVEALASDAWRPVWTEKQKKEDRKRRKRKAKMQSDGAKRVRVISPDTEDYRVIES